MTNDLSAQRKRLIWVATGGLVLVAIAVLVSQLRTPVDRAVPLKNVPLTATEMVELQSCGKSLDNSCLGFHETNRGLYSYRYDLSSGSVERLQALDAIVKSQHSWSPSWVSWRVSPDGKWLLWGLNSRSGPPEYRVAAIDGSSVLAWRNLSRSNSTIEWRADSRAWIQFDSTSNRSGPNYLKLLVIHSIQNSRQSTTIHLDGLQIEPNVIGCLPGNRVVTIDDSGKRICIFSVDSPRTTARTCAVKPVVDWDGGPQVIPSPSGDRLAWLVARTYSGRIGDLEESVWKKNADVSVMVSRLDGSEMRSLGSFREFLVSDGFDLFGVLGWSEDGDYLFIYHDGGIWRVHVQR